MDHPISNGSNDKESLEQKTAPEEINFDGSEDHSTKEGEVTNLVIVLDADDYDDSCPSVDEALTRIDDPSSSAVRPDPEQLRLKCLAFQLQRHSLRISASNVAAMAGYHPYKVLPELLLDLVYQGSLGKALFRMDLTVLGLETVSKEQALLELAAKAGPATRTAVQYVMKVQTGQAVIPSVEEATQLKRRVLKQAGAAAKLNPTELQVLQEGIRSAVDTGFGKKHEGDALDHYEKLTGWPVYERNAQIRAWPFGRYENGGDPTGISDAVAAEDNTHDSWPTANGLPSVAPLRDAYPIWVERDVSPRKEGSERETKRTRQSVPWDNSQIDGHSATESQPKEHPYFLILGSIDGMRDELVPAQSAQGDLQRKDRLSFDDDDWISRQVLVECKHRMGRIHKTPPLYEQIQTAVYCMMYQVKEADIVQIVRRERSGKSKRGKSEVVDHSQTSLNLWIEKGQDENSASAQKQTEILEKKEQAALPPIMTIYRLSLNDDVMAHERNWSEVVLPRLSGFVEAVYTVRSNDNLRYRLLISTSLPSQGMDEAWQILHSLCPWLAGCDTAYQRPTVLETTDGGH